MPHTLGTLHHIYNSIVLNMVIVNTSLITWKTDLYSIVKPIWRSEPRGVGEFPWMLYTGGAAFPSIFRKPKWLVHYNYISIWPYHIVIHLTSANMNHIKTCVNCYVWHICFTDIAAMPRDRFDECHLLNCQVTTDGHIGARWWAQHVIWC